MPLRPRLHSIRSGSLNDSPTRSCQRRFRVTSETRALARVFFHLKHQLQTELNLTIVSAGRCDPSRSIVVRTVLQDWLKVWLAEIRVVKHVKEFGSEREISVLLEHEFLEDGEVHVNQLGPDDCVP